MRLLAGLQRSLSSVLFWFFLNVGALASLLALHFRWEPLANLRWWPDVYALSSSVLAGGVVSFLFYFLVVFLPQRRHRDVINSNLRSVYDHIKRDILYQVIRASQKGGRHDLTADSETVDRLMTVQGFKAIFEEGREGNEGFYAFRNHISDDVPEYREIILSFQMLLKQIDYVLHNYRIEDGAIFDFFKRLEMYLMRLESIGPGHEEEKILSRFIWEIFAGWSVIEGYRGYDIIEKMIGDI